MKKLSLMMLLAAGLLLPAGCIKDEPEIDSLDYTRPLNIAAPVSVISSDYYTFLKRIAHNKPDNAPEIREDEDSAGDRDGSPRGGAGKILEDVEFASRLVRADPLRAFAPALRWLPDSEVLC